MFFINWAKQKSGAYRNLITRIHFLLENVRGTTTHRHSYSMFFTPLSPVSR